MSTPTCTCTGGSPLLAVGLDAPCPCTYHRRYADLYAADPATWGPKMVATARFRAGLPAVPEPARVMRTAALPVSGDPAGALAEPLDAWDYVTTECLLADVRLLLGALPPDIDHVVAIPRSGLLPGSLLAYHLHVPLWTISRQSGLLRPGHGGRMEGADAPPPRHVLLVDDTVALGREMRANAAALRSALPGVRITTAAVYCFPKSVGLVDLFVRAYPGLHYLEWNWTNAGHGETCCYDFDGILCPDFTHEQCADMTTYRAAMAAMKPIQLPRRNPVHTVVTGRPESCRDVTLDWLARWGIRVEHLVMWPSDPHPLGSEVAPWKALHYQRSGCPLFAESDPEQAATINRITGKPVLCPALGRVLPPCDPVKPRASLGSTVDRRAKAVSSARAGGCQTCG